MKNIVPAFDEIDHDIAALVQTVTLAGCETGTCDGEGSPQWLERMRPLSREQRDFVTCQRARQAVRAMAGENRMAHNRFQELLGTAGQFVNELSTNPTLRIRLNPIRVWRQFESRSLMNGDSESPADVLFYPVEDSIRAAVLRPVALERIRPLCRFGSCTIAEWIYEIDLRAMSPGPDRATLIALCRDLMKVGLVALA